MQVERLTAFEGLLAFRTSSLQYTGLLEDHVAMYLDSDTDPVNIPKPARDVVNEAAVECLDRAISEAVDTEREERLAELRERFEE